MIFLKTIKANFFLGFSILYSSGLSFAQIKNQELQALKDAILKYTFNAKLSNVENVGTRYYFDTHCSVFYARSAMKWLITKNVR